MTKTKERKSSRTEQVYNLLKKGTQEPSKIASALKTGKTAGWVYRSFAKLEKAKVIKADEKGHYVCDDQAFQRYLQINGKAEVVTAAHKVSKRRKSS